MSWAVGFGTRESLLIPLPLSDTRSDCWLTSSSRASIYGDSEELLGRYFAANPSKRANIFLATKFGFRFSTVTGQAETEDDGTTPRFDASPRSVEEGCELALKKLGVTQIDLFYAHRCAFPFDLIAAIN
jgi:aryl-alcohol dehydrogenase-like predicted oxidoreductase